MTTMLRFRFAALIGAALWMALPARANEIFVVSTSTGVCDTLAIPGSPTVLDELGTAAGGVPAGGRVSAAAPSCTTTACSSALGSDSAVLPNALVSITNLNSVSFSHVWYVADYDTT